MTIATIEIRPKPSEDNASHASQIYCAKKLHHSAKQSKIASTLRLRNEWNPALMNAENFDDSRIFNPESSRPPFPWEVNLPTWWACLDTRADKIEESGKNFIKDYFPDADEKSPAIQKALADFKGFRKFVKQHNVLTTFILPFPMGDDNYDLALLYFRWTYFPTGSPSINEISEYFEAGKDPNAQAEKTSTNKGLLFFLIHEDRKPKPRYHGYIPIPQHNWVFTVTGETGAPDYYPLVRDTVKRTAKSFSYNIHEEKYHE